MDHPTIQVYLTKNLQKPKRKNFFRHNLRLILVTFVLAIAVLFATAVTIELVEDRRHRVYQYGDSKSVEDDKDYKPTFCRGRFPTAAELPCFDRYRRMNLTEICDIQLGNNVTKRFYCDEMGPSRPDLQHRLQALSHNNTHTYSSKVSAQQ